MQGPDDLSSHTLSAGSRHTSVLPLSFGPPLPSHAVSIPHLHHGFPGAFSNPLCPPASVPPSAFLPASRDLCAYSCSGALADCPPLRLLVCGPCSVCLLPAHAECCMLAGYLIPLYPRAGLEKGSSHMLPTNVLLNCLSVLASVIDMQYFSLIPFFFGGGGLDYVVFFSCAAM